MAAGPSRFWPTHAVSGDAALRPFSESRTAGASETLDGFRAFLDGPYATEDDHSGSAAGNRPRLASVIQSETKPGSDRFDQRCALQISPQSSGFPSILPRHLLSADEQTCLVESCISKPTSPYQPDKRSRRNVARSPEKQDAAERGAGHCDEPTESRLIRSCLKPHPVSSSC